MFFLFFTIFHISHSVFVKNKKQQTVSNGEKLFKSSTVASRHYLQR